MSGAGGDREMAQAMIKNAKRDSFVSVMSGVESDDTDSYKGSSGKGSGKGSRKSSLYVDGSKGDDKKQSKFGRKGS